MARSAAVEAACGLRGHRPGRYVMVEHHRDDGSLGYLRFCDGCGKALSVEPFPEVHNVTHIWLDEAVSVDHIDDVLNHSHLDRLSEHMKTYTP